MSMSWGISDAERHAKLLFDVARTFSTTSTQWRYWLGSDRVVRLYLDFPTVERGARFACGVTRLGPDGSVVPLASSADLLPGSHVTSLTQPVTLLVVANPRYMGSAREAGLLD